MLGATIVIFVNILSLKLQLDTSICDRDSCQNLRMLCKEIIPSKYCLCLNFEAYKSGHLLYIKCCQCMF